MDFLRRHGMMLCILIWFFGGCVELDLAPLDTSTPAGATDLTELERSTSPNGRWAADVRTDLPQAGGVPPENFSVEIHVRSTDGQVSYKPVHEQRRYGLGLSTPTIVRWSLDTSYLYYSERVRVDGCALFSNLSGLWRLHLENGEIASLLPGSRTLSIAPDETKVAYIDWSTMLFIHDIQREQSLAVPLDFIDDSAAASLQIGNIVWSPDSSVIALTVAHMPCSLQQTHSIVRIEAATNRSSVLLKSDPRQLTILEWQTPPQLMLVDRENQRWTMDAITGELERINE